MGYIEVVLRKCGSRGTDTMEVFCKVQCVSIYIYIYIYVCVCVYVSMNVYDSAFLYFQSVNSCTRKRSYECKEKRNVILAIVARRLILY